ncbi:MAG: gamma-glutamyl-gamma-aminobutyrate hydrolase family protein, partial [Planctomycetota bacterium]
MAIARGGSLHQFLPDLDGPDEHRKFTDDDWNRRHDVIAEGKLAELVGETMRVNTNHRQAVREPGDDMHVCGRAPDGVIEAIEDASLPFWLGVQWHPERMPNEPAGWPIIAALVRAAGQAGSQVAGRS